ncbi:MAG: LPS-assembly protein LptD [Chitinophagaceae bacterium]|nr:LPS-assembly protein LptD [Chitinophagaceae bacterium]
MVICLLFLNTLTSAQVVKISYADTSKIKKDTVRPADSLHTKSGIPISADKLDSEVKYQAKDSMVYDAIQKKLLLYTDAEITYEDIKVTADYIEYLQDSSLLTALEIALEVEDTSRAKPRIYQGNEFSTFSALRFNFKSKRALIENAYSQYGEGFILSNQVKRNNDNSINGYGNIYTTCSDPHPHFGIAARKIKIIPNKIAVSGPANLVIEEIPTPLYLPFGLFPLKQGQRSGFKLPTYDMSENLGFGLREGGYYFAISDHVDLLALADVYALGTWRAGIVSNYIYRYRFNGNFSFNYAYNKIGESYEPGNSISRNFFITWSHTINPNVLPGSNFSANVNVGSSKYQTNNTYDANLYLNNNYSSNISYSKTWKDKPINFSAALRHNQNTQTRLVQLTLPELNFSVNQIFPFQFRKDVIKPRWYEKIGASYQFSALNRLDFYDSTFSLSTLKFDDFQNGFKHSVPINASYNLLKFFNLTFGANYNEYWYTKKMLRQYNFAEGSLDTSMQTGFFTARDFNLSSAISTRIYGIKLFKKGAVKGIRHVITPSVRFNYRPDFGRGIFNYYYNSFVDQSYTNQRLSYFEGALLGMPPDGKVAGVGFDLGNTLQLKVRNKKDTLGGTKKVSLIDGLNIASFYNLAVDSFRWSNVSIVYRNTLFENINISGGMSYSLYAIDKTSGRLTPEFEYKANGRLMRFDRANVAIGASLPVRKNKSALNRANEDQTQAIGRNYSGYADFNVPWSLNVNYSINASKNFLVAKQKDTLVLTQDVNFFGDVNLTTKWKIGIRSGYDFATKKISFTTFDIYRDLHCWEMRLNLIPFGYRKSYNFGLNVKASVLQDLKLVRRRDFRDNI